MRTYPLSDRSGDQFHIGSDHGQAISNLLYYWRSSPEACDACNPRGSGLIS
jgi:hypothetical protein